MHFEAKYFHELTTTELYEILKVRSSVFVVEQKILYQDMDGIDYDSLHVFCPSDTGIKAYLRIFYKKGEPGTVQIGRVLTTVRGTGLGRELLKEGIRLAMEKMHADRVYLEAQVYAIGFYERVGFKVCSEEFLEDGIPHVKMMREI